MGTFELEVCVPEETYGKTVPECAPFTFFDHYVNVCVPASLIQFNDQENESGMYVIYGYVLPILSSIVFTTHLVVIWVLNEQKLRRASVEPLLWMAISAVFMAISPLPFTIYYYNLGHMRDYNQTVFLCYLQKISMEILPFFFNTLITFFTLLLGVQRFIAIQYPLNSIHWCQRKKMRLVSKIILVVSVIISVVHFSFDVRTIYHFCITSQPGQSFWVARCFIGYSPITRSVGTGVLSQMFDIFRVAITLVPCVFLLVITFLLIRAVRTNDKTFVIGTDNRHVSTINRHKTINRASRNTTVMLTVIIILFLVGRLPSTILILMVNFQSYFGIANLDFLHDVYLRALANTVIMTVHPISFAIYMLMSKQFRVSLRKLLGFRWLATDEEMRRFSKNNFSGAQKSHRSKSTRASLGDTKFDSSMSFRSNYERSSTRPVLYHPNPKETDCFLHPGRLPPRSVSNPTCIQKSSEESNV